VHLSPRIGGTRHRSDRQKSWHLMASILRHEALRITVPMAQRKQKRCSVAMVGSVDVDADDESSRECASTDVVMRM